MPEKFCEQFLRMQGVVIYPPARKISGIIERRQPEQAPVKTLQYERN